jgi:predicted XRE-type DNA-binding protein
VNKGNTPDEKFLEAQIALLMDASAEGLDEVLRAAGLEPLEIEKQGMNAIKGALTSLQVAKQAVVLSDLSVARQREVAARLGIKRSVFAALVEHRVIVASIPKRLLQRLANEIGVSVQALRDALCAPVVAAPAAQYRSDVAPKAPVQVSFEQLLREAGMSQEQIAALMREVD